VSAQFGKCNFDGKPVDPHDLDEVRPVLAPYGPDGEGFICKDNLGILYRAFHTTKESRREIQPHVAKSGAVITWDGRLDNREDLIEKLGEGSPHFTDLEIVAAAYERWGTNAFAEMVGDWALSIWNPKDQSLVLAKDFVGTRHLHYIVEKDQVSWCTILDPLVGLANHPLTLQEEYIAGWLAFFPASQLTPYFEIRSVQPSSFVRLDKGTQCVRRYWDFDPGKRIYNHKDAEYEEHFRSVFMQSVRRRLRSDAPVLAELSGGMDSSSIVCMADAILARGNCETPRLDTASYYCDSEPNWNERPYFTKVEERRGRAGCHIDVSPVQSHFLDDCSGVFPVTPGSGHRPTEPTKKLAYCMAAQGNRVLLSGIGGDEVTGGVPTPLPELADLMARLRVLALARQLKVWALDKRRPWFHLLFETARGFLPGGLVPVPKHRRPAPWLCTDFVGRNLDALNGYESPLKLFGPRPSFQGNLGTLEALRRQLACEVLSFEPVCERRYPYLDRDLLEFLYAIPREQLVRPGQRRALMRRALVGIVPDEVLNRKRKAFVVRAPLPAAPTELASPSETGSGMVASSLGIIDLRIFSEALELARRGFEVPMVPLLRTLGIESWLRRLSRRQRPGKVMSLGRNGFTFHEGLSASREPCAAAELGGPR
jgi:asparagine synthase (glutamine-hydrolysing)